jgi:crotonobetainyl-CoA:carnitine CoA-transferase CaiB-like acyl-CoA transferase
MTQRAGRDINYLASSGILSKFRRNNKVGTPAVPANILTYYASGSLYALSKILSAIHIRQPYTVIDCNLTMQLAYTAQPVLLDAHLNHIGEKGARISQQTLP